MALPRIGSYNLHHWSAFSQGKTWCSKLAGSRNKQNQDLKKQANERVTSKDKQIETVA